MNQNKIVFISWAPYCSRSDNIARELGGESYMVYYEFLGSNYYTIALKYILQTLKTLCILFSQRPDTVFVMSPSVFATIPVLIYCRLFRAKFVIDAHTGALENLMWKRVIFLQQYFCRNALFTMVTNRKLAQYVENWRADYRIVTDVPIVCEKTAASELNENINVLFVNSYSADEPLAELLEAAKSLAGVNFYITGKIESSKRALLNSCGRNVVFTDFLTDEKYYGLMNDVDIVAALTKNDNTMQRGAYEAIYMGKPVVTSDWKVLRDNFHKGAVFVDNSVQGIVGGIESAIQNLDALTDDALALKADKQCKWQENKEAITRTIGKKL